MFNTVRRSSLLLVLILFCAAASFAQQSPPPSTPPAASGNRNVTLDVVVTPKSGPPVSDLQQQDFTILDNKSPQTIASFHAVTGRDAPIEVVLVIDTVNTDYDRISYERIQIDKFLRAEAGRLAYPIAIAVVSDKDVQILGGSFSTDGNALATALDKDEIGLRTITRSTGYYGATERLQISLHALHQLVASEAARPKRKIMLWISPGWPLLSGPNTMLDSKEQQQIFADIVSFSNQLEQARVTLYSVNPLGTNESLIQESYYKDFLKGVSKPSQVLIGDLGLQVLAVQSGGLSLNLSNDIAGALTECLADSAPYYEISFVAPASAQPDEYHHLEIKIDKPELTARTRQGYYAHP
jgi:VWFA-related protein